MVLLPVDVVVRKLDWLVAAVVAVPAGLFCSNKVFHRRLSSSIEWALSRSDIPTGLMFPRASGLTGRYLQSFVRLSLSPLGLWAFLSRLLLEDDLFWSVDDDDLLVFVLLVVLQEGLGDSEGFFDRFLERDLRFSVVEGSDSDEETGSCFSLLLLLPVLVGVVSVMLSVLLLLLLSSSLLPRRAAMMLLMLECWVDSSGWSCGWLNRGGLGMYT